MSNYKSAIDRINKAQTVEELHKVGEGLERVYRWAQLTDS